MIKVTLKKDNLGLLQVDIDGVNFGVFDDIDRGNLSWFPKRTEQLSGDQIIAIGEALNEANNQMRCT
ncbi:hypothetical protein [Vibrio anguillarum]|uniref:Uncharacterized protein n=1 Tax=Vibrio anguillarum TaxID=55601 RepID=A0A7U6FS43_VIBAN|nr:hypothetical protein [Vibrio anguillarum]AZS26308.1 hypothetical protein DYL72_15475 [Vibrio anguillarum]MBF4374450.1 hypothetical protein [Vibrio anguillarum]